MPTERKPLTEEEHEIVQKMHLYHCAAQLSVVVLNFAEYPEILDSGFPPKEEVKEDIVKLDFESSHLTHLYRDVLPRFRANPLELEQQAWNLLSPTVRTYVNEFRTYLESYPPELTPLNREGFSNRLSRGIELIFDWKIIGQSYEAKRSNDSEYFSEKEQAVRELIKKLSQPKTQF